jgi:hypothetical protein
MERTAEEVIRETEALLERCQHATLERHAFATWRTIRESDGFNPHDFLPCQEFGLEEIEC